MLQVCRTRFPGLIALAALVAVPTAHAGVNLGQVMALGDSLTYGTEPDDANFVYPGGYRTTFYNRLSGSGGAGDTFQFVGSTTANPGALPANQTQQEGHPGVIIGRSANRGGAGSDGGLYAYLSAATMTESGTTGTPYINANAQPSTILLLAGTNDILNNFNVENPAGYTAATYNPYTQSPYTSDAEMKDLLTATFAALPNTHVYLATLPLIAVTTANTTMGNSAYFNYFGTSAGSASNQIAIADSQIKNFNQDEALLVSQFSAHYAITLVDVASKFTLNASGADANGYYSSDGIHPSDAGYQVLGNAFADAVLTVAAAPEPTSALLLTLAAGPLILGRRRRRTSAA